MLLLPVIVTLSFSCALSAEVRRPTVPFDFLGPEAEELRRERPLAFNPDDGHNFRREFEEKNGYRGERLIVQLGGGASAPPLAIYDASLIKPTVAPLVTTHSTPTIVTFRPAHSQVTPFHIRTTAAPVKKFTEEPTTTAPVKRKYFNLTRFKKDRLFGKSAPKATARTNKKADVVEPTPSTNDAVVQKRLYRAIWNHGLKGVTESDADKVNESLKNFEVIAPPNFNSLDLMQQLAEAMNGNQEQPSFSLAAPQQPSESPVEPTPTPGDGHLLHALAASATTDALPTPPTETQVSDLEPVFVGGEPSLNQFAGVGQPSLLVASYSYSEVLHPHRFGVNVNSPPVTPAAEVTKEEQPAPASESVPTVNVDDPLSGASEVKLHYVKP